MKIQKWLKTILLIAVLLLYWVAWATSDTAQHDKKCGHHRKGCSFASRFANPNAPVRPKFRWWWPGSYPADEELINEIYQIADAGFGGVEIADVWDSVTSEEMDNYDYGTPEWNHKIAVALQAAKDIGLRVDLTIGPHWPSVVPSEDPNREGFAKEIVYGQAIVDSSATYRGTVPDPEVAPNPVITEKELIAVQAVQCVSGCTPASDGDSVLLDETTWVDLTADVNNGEITWTAPDSGTSPWVLLSFWMRGTGQIDAMHNMNPGAPALTDPQAYVVDHFSRAGAQTVIDYWESTLLTDEIKSLLLEVGGHIFEDSLELTTNGHWTPEMVDEFEQRRGYNIEGYLPLVVNKVVGTGFEAGSYPVFAFTRDIGARVRHDYEQTLSDLYLEYRVSVFKEWTHSFGMGYRNQGYGATIDSILSAATTDIPEGESLGFGDNGNDRYRALAAGRDMGGNRILSDEVGAYLFSAYNIPWEQLLETMHTNYASGVNQMVVHGFAYADAPNAEWPGFAAFSPMESLGIGFAEAWGPRQPTWDHVGDGIGDYLARTQAVLQNGTSQTDVAIYLQDFNISGVASPIFADTGLTQAGYSYGFLSHGALDLPSATVKHGRLAPNGPAYKALVLNNPSTMPLETAQKILDFAQAGLPIVVIGTVPSRTPGYFDAAAQDAALQAVITQLLAQPGVHQVATEADVPDTLQAFGVRPAAESAQPSDILNVHRVEGNVDYFYFYNPNTASADVTVSLAAKGQPYALDAWTGKIRPIALYVKTMDRTQVQVRLDPKEATIIAVTDINRFQRFQRRPTGPHATSSDADEVLFDKRGRLRIRASAPGRYATTLSNGRTVEVNIRNVPQVQTLSNWYLEVEDWQPGASATETDKVLHAFNLTALVPWSEISGIENASGIGRYTTSVELSGRWTGGCGAYLDLGNVFDTFQLTINGRTVPLTDQSVSVSVVDVGDYLKPGVNTIQVTVATTLNNRLSVARPDPYASQAIQDYGLIGPVKLIPYGEATVRAGRLRSDS